jgi:hypothetical protein
MSTESVGFEEDDRKVVIEREGHTVTVTDDRTN